MIHNLELPKHHKSILVIISFLILATMCVPALRQVHSQELNTHFITNDYGCSNGSRYCSELNILQFVASSSNLIRITGPLGGHPGNPDIGDEDNDK
jgi:hypothetical protein